MKDSVINSVQISEVSSFVGNPVVWNDNWKNVIAVESWKSIESEWLAISLWRQKHEEWDGFTEFLVLNMPLKDIFLRGCCNIKLPSSFKTDMSYLQRYP